MLLITAILNCINIFVYSGRANFRFIHENKNAFRNLLQQESAPIGYERRRKII